MVEKIKYFVISLPRSGTSSLRVMFETLGFTVLHSPGNTFFRSIDYDIDFYCDTPIYTENCIKDILEWCDSNSFTPKFIYINRSAKSVWNSWNQSGLYKIYLEMYERREKGEPLTDSQLFDIESYNDAFGNEKWTDQNSEELVLKHKEKVCNLVNHSGKPLLVFDFDKGYDQLCKFLKVDLPVNLEVPYINKSNKDYFIHNSNKDSYIN